MIGNTVFAVHFLKGSLHLYVVHLEKCIAYTQACKRINPPKHYAMYIISS